jgi:hypothetical protein
MNISKIEDAVCSYSYLSCLGSASERSRSTKDREDDVNYGRIGT